jgi:hypothetical protein
MKCTYCGEEEATTFIPNPNPNFEEGGIWDVCNDCRDIIKQQQKLSFGMIVSSMKEEKNKNFNEIFGRRIMKEATAEIDKIAKRTKKPIMSTQIVKNKDGKYDYATIVHTGDEK